MAKHWIFVVAVALALGCGGTLRTNPDAGTEPDADPDGSGDATLDPAPDEESDAETDTYRPECSDGLDNDGDDLVDLEDWDCEEPWDELEGPPAGGCTIDNHCAGGWEECDRDTGTCYDPPEGGPCDPCRDSSDCGDGVMGDDPDRDWCLITGAGGRCSKDCAGDFDCPKGFVCDTSDGIPGLCVPYVESCGNLDSMGGSCARDSDCGWGSVIVCEDSICTSPCEEEHHCPAGWSCTTGRCFQD